MIGNFNSFLYLHDKHSRLEERAYSRRRDGIN